MRRMNVLGLACALLMSAGVSANAAYLGLNGSGLYSAPTSFGGGGNLLPLNLTQSAVINGGMGGFYPGIGGNFYGGNLGSNLDGNLDGTTVLPYGTQLVSNNASTAVILPGMVGMPSLSGCNVSVVGPGPSALSLIGNNCLPVASLPAECPKTITRITTTTTTITRTYARAIVHHRKRCHRIIRHKCPQVILK
jgi:hypothetical protein